MTQVLSRAALLAAASVFIVVAVAKDAPVAADPKAVELVRELGLAESPTALRDMPGWKPPKTLLMISQTPLGGTSQKLRDSLQAAAPGLEVVMVGTMDEFIARAKDVDAIAGGDDVVCDERVLAAAKKLRWAAVYSAGVEYCLGKQGVGCRQNKWRRAGNAEATQDSDRVAHWRHVRGHRRFELRHKPSCCRSERFLRSLRPRIELDGIDACVECPL